jgi:hypothetical protein
MTIHQPRILPTYYFNGREGGALQMRRAFSGN